MRPGGVQDRAAADLRRLDLFLVPAALPQVLMHGVSDVPAGDPGLGHRPQRFVAGLPGRLEAVRRLQDTS